MNPKMSTDVFRYRSLVLMFAVDVSVQLPVFN